ncbi:40S ribosomal protein S10, putative (macronuclear) [Tetrahymena thermophila SB210]|uniref:40S ribosomal protein S10, putative n=2 Tax=Tetrahymena thermophila TaxID=5911 RepID=Q24F70_TETTS|nr:40S ribosomal protein S10, putative [Tetrahymena thermophila SB210]2XZN_7 Chain 7, Plectin/s10 Domain Containing Protein [Tetrahymena thermophila]4BPN_7 Chain 7, 40s Ribosomal Protein Rps10e [Tetrahymena thermophila]4BPO_7 Chain 7, 40s Ribosomal Protein Rps10e [Tetrahymena thermophila]4BTS_A7 Chain A7, 40S RIBOSOMAL PROTEIN RPS10E [Tetrahymena thermophila]4BTS_B7 Chain B7, 40S RIBOSOMAL PROTEIN RPS10E [Tetrahymena thermophila]4BTS_C7 Chain C7, 40S RIBOSOMAL PROTEIN RPS10E [Tetrahymena ther|eukprot:XP_001026650.1 40S ribosomal protein S10, putative [Tetrahymena thermophila SB210]
MVHVLKATKIRIYKQLLQDGVFVLKKDFEGHHEETGVPNLHCYILVRSLKDRGFLEEIFNWGFTYYYLNKEGCEYLKTKLGISADNVIPKTFKASNVNFISKEEDEEERPRRQFNKGGRTGERDGRNKRGVGRGTRREGEEAAKEEGAAETAQGNQETPAQE